MAETGFDRIAAGYDDSFTETAVGRLQRAVVHRYLETIIAPELLVLELNCGTGEDALWLARQRCRVLATDLSSEMVSLAASKAGSAGLNAFIQAEQLDIRSLAPGATTSPGSPGSPFDLVFSNFGGLNCVRPEELRRFGGALPELLKPGGVFVAVIMGRFCWWETLYFLFKGRFREAFRRLPAGPVEARLDPQTTVPCWYYSPDEFRHFFPDFRIRTIQPVGFWLPPSYLDPWFSHRPRCLRVLNFLEKKCRGRLWARAADHFLIVLEKQT